MEAEVLTRPASIRQLRVDSVMSDRAREYAALFVKDYVHGDGDALRRAEAIRAQGSGIAPDILFEALAKAARCTVEEAERMFGVMTRRLAVARSEYSKALIRGESERAARIAKDSGLPQQSVDKPLNEALKGACEAASVEETSIRGTRKLLDLKRSFDLPDTTIGALIEQHGLQKPYEFLVQQGYPRVQGVSFGQSQPS